MLIGTFLGSIILGVLFLHFYIPRIITEIKNPLIQSIKPDLKSKPNVPTFEERIKNGKTIEFTSFDGVKIKGFLSYSETKEAEGTILLLHGIRAYKEHFIPISQKLTKAGFNTIAIDSRAHWESGGKHCTFGVKEKKDIKALIDFLENEEEIKQNIGLWGQSLGGAIALQAMAFDKRIEFGVIESTFTDFKTITNDYFNYHLGFNISPLSNYLVKRSGKIAGFDPEEAKPLLACKNIDQPILLVHGTKDQRINIEYAKKNFSNLKSKDKTFVEFEEGTHLNIWKVGGPNYLNQVLDFFKEQTLENNNE